MKFVKQTQARGDVGMIIVDQISFNYLFNTHVVLPNVNFHPVSNPSMQVISTDRQ
jgi:hypothetical protein